MHLGAEWVAPSLARDRVTAWLRSQAWPQEQLEDVVFAVSEAVSNSVEHGYRIPAGSTERPDGAVVRVEGEIVAAREGGRQAVITIRDRGRWKAPTPGPTDRGRGLPLMRVSSAHVQVLTDRSGTTVVLRSHAVP
jgi:serine/threonine-protein kinase RsbW